MKKILTRFEWVTHMSALSATHGCLSTNMTYTKWEKKYDIIFLFQRQNVVYAMVSTIPLHHAYVIGCNYQVNQSYILTSIS